MGLLVCLLLLLLNFASVSGSEIDICFVNYSDRECVLMNQVCGSSLWNAETETRVTLTTKDEQTPIVLQPGEKFRGSFCLSKDLLQDNDVFLIKIGESIFKLRFDGEYATMSCIYGENERIAALCTNYKGAELNHKRRYIIQDDDYRIIQIKSMDVYFFLINNAYKSPEGDLTVPNGNSFEDLIRYEREFGDMYGRFSKRASVFKWSDPILPTTAPVLPKKKRCGCVIL